MIDVTIRNATLEDLDSLAQMNLRLYTEGERRREKSIEDLKDRFRYYLTNSAWNVHIAMIDDNDVGYVLWRFEDDDVYIRHIWLHSDYRGRGLSEQVLDILTDEFWGTKRLRIQMFATNERMRNYWKLQGFKERSIIMERSN
ncbi:MAG: GNAT family N-acetyltransferase [Alphaproteobacteria bacterium]